MRQVKDTLVLPLEGLANGKSVSAIWYLNLLFHVVHSQISSL